MDPWIHTQQLAVLMTSMYEEGLLDRQFQQIQWLQNEENPNVIPEYVTMFSDNVERKLRELQNLLKEADTDYDKMEACAHELNGYCLSLGALSVRLASTNFLVACDDNDREGCHKSYKLVESEYLYLLGKLEKMVQLEQRIQLSERKGQK